MTSAHEHDEQQTSKDVAYSPASERETEEKQRDGGGSPDVDASRVGVAPGTGGPDDVGDVEVDPDELRDAPGAH